MLDWYMLEKRVSEQEQVITCEAEERRVLNEALEGQPEIITLYDRALVSLGYWLMDRGRAMQERHGDEHLSPTRTPLRIQASMSASECDHLYPGC